MNLHEFQLLQAKAREERVPQDQVYLGTGTCGLAAGAGSVLNFLKNYLKEHSPGTKLIPVGCIGLDEEEVLMDIQKANGPRYSYGRVDETKAQLILESHLRDGKPVEQWLVGITPSPGQPFPDLPFYRHQKRVVLQRCGFINPEDFQDYLAWDGYSALNKVLTMSPEEVIDLVDSAGLRGRGGAGFPTGRKWRFAREAPGEPKYVICNADEGDPGAFMDRSLLEGDPHGVLEGLIISGYAIGANLGYIYIRAEYPLAIRRLRIALAQARRHGLLGDHILGSGFSFNVQIKEGAGAFVCGEETALMTSIEGKRGMPNPRPPYPAQRGLWGKPTNINNVETLANIPVIIKQGSQAYRSLGNSSSPGTKIFAITGKVANTGLAEVPLGITLRELLFDLAGGLKEGEFKAVQIGGPSGGCLPANQLDTPIDYDSLIAAGAMMGSGGMVVLNQSTCMVNLARFFTDFNRKESCGKCTPCREGTQRLWELLTKLSKGHGEEGDLDKILNLAQIMQQTSLCGLGQTAANPVLSTYRYFAHEYAAHLKGECPAGVCFKGGREAID
jgi:NADH-quinone oxidoreductase subunit F